MPTARPGRRVVLAWELGGGFGHLARLRMFARHLTAGGHQCTAAVPRLDIGRDFFGPSAEAVQGPRRPAPPRNIVEPQLSYATLLHNVGFDDPTALAMRVQRWRTLFGDAHADLVVCDHSPFALIAARTLELPVLHVGTGFTVPPITEPFPSFQPDMDAPNDLLVSNEASVNASLSLAMRRLGLPPFERLQDIFAGTTRGLLEYPELDPYDVARPEGYLGVPFSPEGTPPEWPAHEGPRVFVYLRGPTASAAVFEALHVSHCTVLAAVGQASIDDLRQYERPGLKLTDQLVDLGQAAATCDAFVNHSSHGVVSEMLLAGKPGLLLPRVHEQVLLATHVARLGAGTLPGGRRPSDLAAALNRLVEDESLRRGAEQCAGRWRAQPRESIVAELVTAMVKARTSGT